VTYLTALENLPEANKHFRSLVTLHIRVTLLSDVCQAAGYPQGRAINIVLQSLTAPEVNGLIPALGAVYRHSAWEHLNLSRQLNAKGLGHLSQSPNDQSAALHTITPSDESDPSGSSLNLPPQLVERQEGEVEPSFSTSCPFGGTIVMKQNAKALNHVASELPKTLKNFFTGIHRPLID
jgi:E3 ubiquitin-protein ligase HUWE1